MVVEVNGSEGRLKRVDKKEPVAQQTAAAIRRRNPNVFPSPDPSGRTSIATPAKPTTTLPRVPRDTRSPVAQRNRTTQSGTDAMIRAARLEATSLSASTTSPFPPSRSAAPTNAHDT